MKILLITILLAMSSSLFAKAHNCENPQSQMEMNLCAMEEAEKAEDKLQEVYEKAMANKAFDNKTKILLGLSQSKWDDFMDAQCELEGDFYRGGSIQPLIVTTCYTKLIEERTHKIEEMITQEGL